MKKKLIFFLLLASALLVCVALPAYALDSGLSPGLRPIATECSMVKSGLRGESLTFSTADFRRALGSAKFDSITVTALPEPTKGILKLSGLRVTEGQEIAAEHLGYLTFTPAGDQVEESAFSFICPDLSRTEMTCRLRITDSKNSAPTVADAAAMSLTAWTQKNLPARGRVRAEDPDGDAISFQVVKYPRRGSLVMDSDGSYVYTPDKNYTGEDSFTYVARDEYGNYSTVATVEVSVTRRVSKVSYDDLEDGQLNSVLVMTANSIMNGSISGDQLLFDPNGQVTRSEFTVMAMKAVGLRPSANSAGRTFFDDDDKIPAAERSYIAMAQSRGYINGSFDGTGLYFRPNDPITAAEASVILSRLAGIDDDGVSPAITAEGGVPSWAAIPASALCQAGVVDPDWLTPELTTRNITRMDAADLLFNVMRYLKKG